MTAKGMSPAQVQDFLYRDCGLKGLSGVSNDMRSFRTAAIPCGFCRDYFVYRAGLHAGMLGLPCKVLTPLSSPQASAKTPSAFGPGLRSGWNGSGYLSIRQAMPGTRLRISGAASRIPVYVVPTDEELMIAEHTLSLLWDRHSSSSPNRMRAS